MKNSELIALLNSYIIEYHQKELLTLINSSAEDSSITTNSMNLFEFNASFADLLLTSPKSFLQIFNNSLNSCFNFLVQNNKGLEKKCKLSVRINGLPLCPELIRKRLPKSIDVGRFLSVSGTIIRMSAVKMLEIDRQFICNKCKNNFPVQADIDQYFSVCKPTKCPRCDNLCSFTPLSKGLAPVKCRSLQEFRMQESITQLNIGMMPRSISVILLDGLVDTCKPGDNVTVTGIIIRRWRNILEGGCVHVEIAIEANHIENNNCQKSNITATADLAEEFKTFWDSYRDCPLVGRNKIISFFCPQIFGMDLLKLAIALILAGGVQRTDENGGRIRGQSHLLMIGDPGTGKSQLMKYICRIVPRSILTTGIGSTSAGLTVTAVKESGEWQLEAGALVLSDGGVCCIDEFSTMRSSDQASMLEAMEQQTISVAKAGIVCKLDTRCTIVASANPKGQYDVMQDMTVNTAIASSLLSRFDLVAVIRDSMDSDRDFRVSTHLLTSRQLDTDYFTQEKLEPVWDIEKLKSYFTFIKSINPILSPEAMEILSCYYKERRKSIGSQASRTTMRMLESIIRLSQGHARLMMRKIVNAQDAIFAVLIMQVCEESYSLCNGSHKLQSEFSPNPDQEYLKEASNLLSRLGLCNILNKETQLNKFVDPKIIKLCTSPSSQIKGTSFNQHEKSNFKCNTDKENLNTYISDIEYISCQSNQLFTKTKSKVNNTSACNLNAYEKIGSTIKDNNLILDSSGFDPIYFKSTYKLNSLKSNLEEAMINNRDKNLVQNIAKSNQINSLNLDLPDSCDTDVFCCTSNLINQDTIKHSEDECPEYFTNWVASPVDNSNLNISPKEKNLKKNNLNVFKSTSDIHMSMPDKTNRILDTSTLDIFETNSNDYLCNELNDSNLDIFEKNFVKCSSNNNDMINIKTDLKIRNKLEKFSFKKDIEAHNILKSKLNELSNEMDVGSGVTTKPLIQKDLVSKMDLELDDLNYNKKLKENEEALVLDEPVNINKVKSFDNIVQLNNNDFLNKNIFSQDSKSLMATKNIDLNNKFEKSNLQKCVNLFNLNIDLEDDFEFTLINSKKRKL